MIPNKWELIAAQRANNDPVVQEAREYEPDVIAAKMEVAVLKEKLHMAIIKVAGLDNNIDDIIEKDFFHLSHACIALGVTHGVVIKRIKRGQYYGAQIAGRWYISKDDYYTKIVMTPDPSLEEIDV